MYNARYHVPTAEERYGEKFIESLYSMTYRETGGWVSFHYIEGFQQCPYYALHKHLWHGAAEALHAFNRREWRDDIFSASSADLLGKALMAGVASGAEAASQTYLKGLKPTADRKQAIGYLSLVHDRAEEAANLVHELAGEDEFAIEYPFCMEWPKLHVRGHIDALIGRKDCCDIVEIKCSDNRSFIEERSMQTHFYKHILETGGYKIRDIYYILFPSWKAGNSRPVVIKNPIRKQWTVANFFNAATRMMDTPMNPDLWPATGVPTKCKTCQFYGICGRKG